MDLAAEGVLLGCFDRRRWLRCPRLCCGLVIGRYVVGQSGCSVLVYDVRLRAWSQVLLLVIISSKLWAVPLTGIDGLVGVELICLQDAGRLKEGAAGRVERSVEGVEALRAKGRGDRD